MRTNYRRIALLTGVSAAALGGTPAFAQVEPSIEYNNTAATINDMVEICVDLSPDADCLFGVAATGAGVVNATVDDNLNGQLEVFANATAGDLELLVLGDGDATVAAAAVATGPAPTANAAIDIGLEVRGEALATGADAAVTIDLANDLAIVAVADAQAAVGGAANADARATGIVLAAMADDVAIAAMNNDAALTIAAVAAADGDAGAIANAGVVGIVQSATGDTAIAAGTNDGLIDIDADASAFAAAGPANATAVADGIFQRAIGATTAIAEYDNVGTLDVDAVAVASGTDVANAMAIARFGMAQSATADFVLQSMVNGGTITVAANATAVAAPIGTANALAVAGHGMAQFAIGAPLTPAATPVATASQFMANTGAVFVSANATATGGAFAGATAVAGAAMFQSASGTNVFQSMANAGTVTATANASAVAIGVVDGLPGEEVDAGTAFANAFALGMVQNARGGAITQVMTNSGIVNVGAHAFASAPATATPEGALPSGLAFAFAVGTGAAQFPNGTTQAVTFTNSGTIDVNVAATAVGTTGGAVAVAGGYFAGAGAATLTATVVNSGTMNVTASAVAPGTAFASAQGILVQNLPTAVPNPLDPIGPPLGFAGNPLNGAISNAGTINVVAFATGVAETANATGIFVSGGINNVTIENSGVIAADAIVANGGAANATGILVVGAGGLNAVPLATDVLTITNDGGTIVVRESIDGGATWRRGRAVGVAAAPNNTVINLLGDGFIYGNIGIQDGDNIFVELGDTVFDGIINPECMPVGGPTAVMFDNAALSACGQGTLTIQNGGDLILVSGNDDPDMDNGPSYIFVDTFNVAGDGTITFLLEPTTGGAQPIGTYPQVFADVANLDGTLVAEVNTTAILPQNSWFWNNVIDANTRNGTFDQCLINFNGANVTDSIFVDFGCVYEDGNVDLAFERIGFNEIAGLTPNQMIIANTIEGVFAPTLTGPFGNLLLQLLRSEDQADFADALDMLSGVEYPNYLHAVRNNTFVLNSFVSDQMDCAIHIRGLEECRDPTTRGRVWVKGTYNDVNFDGDDNLIGYDATNWLAMLGGDLQFGHAKVGAFAGYRDIDVDFPNSIIGSGIEADGWMLGVYGAYDVGSFYVRAIGSHSWLGGDSERRIQIGTIDATARGEPDLNVWSIYGEAGGRFDVGGSWVTPYVAIDHTSMKLKAFDETDGVGAGLGIDSQTESQTSGLIGVKWAGNWGGIVPEAKIAYRHDFTGDLGVDMRFIDGPAGASFRKEESYKEGSVIAGVSLAGALGTNVTGRIGYQGRFNNDVRDHAVYGALTFLFGAPPPPPPLPPPPTPPPLPTMKTCPDGTVLLATEPCPTPPPPPPPAPERG